MKLHRMRGMAVILGTVAAVACTPVLGAVPTFIGLGQLSSGSGSKAYDVSPDGTMIVGQAKNSSGETVAVIYDLSGSPTLISLGFLPSAATNESKLRPAPGFPLVGEPGRHRHVHGHHLCGRSG